MQDVQKVMPIVISLGFFGMIPNENVRFSWGGFWSVGGVSESDTRNIWTHFPVTNFFSSISLQYQPNYHKQDFLITTSKIPHHLLQPQIINP